MATKRARLTDASDLVLVEHHVGDALVDGEGAAGLGADEGALLDVDLEERVVDAAEGAALDAGGEDLLRGGLLLGEEVGEVERAGGGDERAPVDLREQAPDEVGVELHLLGAPAGRLQLQRVARSHAPDVRRQHVVSQEPHLSLAAAALLLSSGWLRGLALLRRRVAAARSKTLAEGGEEGLGGV
jgi:hypothetical protein